MKWGKKDARKTRERNEPNKGGERAKGKTQEKEDTKTRDPIHTKLTAKAERNNRGAKFNSFFGFLHVLVLADLCVCLLHY